MSENDEAAELEGFRDAVAAALYEVESRHHIHGTQCLCGFESHRSRERTAHIARSTMIALLGDDALEGVPAP